MATTYVDTSALVKRYVAEVGSAWVRRMVARPVHTEGFVVDNPLLYP